jgi:hypothetical protein
MTQFGPQKSVQFSRRAGLLRLQWQPVEEVIGSALAASRAALVGHTVETHVPADLPLVQYDAVLIERVVSNLLENAGKYTSPGSMVAISAERRGVWIDSAVTDDGPAAVGSRLKPPKIPQSCSARPWIALAIFVISIGYYRNCPIAGSALECNPAIL